MNYLENVLSIFGKFLPFCPFHALDPVIDFSSVYFAGQRFPINIKKSPCISNEKIKVLTGAYWSTDSDLGFAHNVIDIFGDFWEIYTRWKLITTNT